MVGVPVEEERMGSSTSAMESEQITQPARQILMHIPRLTFQISSLEARAMSSRPW